MTERQKLYDLKTQHARHVAAAKEALNKGDKAGYDEAMAKAQGMHAEISQLETLVQEMDRYAQADAPRIDMDKADRHDLREMGQLLKDRREVRLSLSRDSLRNATTLASGAIVEPTGAGTTLRDGPAGSLSSLIDQVSVINAQGMGGWDEPYVISDMAAQGGTVASQAGSARTPSDPTFAKAHLAPWEVNVTSYVDRNLKNLSPVDYAAKIQGMAMRALRRKINALIVNGDGAASPTMFGLTNAKNTDAANIFASVSLGTAVAVDTVEKLVYAYGGDEDVGGMARLVLTKPILQAIGALRGTNEKKRLFEVRPDANNPNTGVIADGGMIVPYTISSSVGAAKIGYIDPANYLLALFGDYTVRVDESYKAGERMDTILGDAMVGGNLVVHHGAVVGTITPAQQGQS